MTAAPLRVLMVSPIRMAPETTRARAQALSDLSDDRVVVDLVPLPEGSPTALDTAEQVEEAGEVVAAVARAADPDRYDLVVPDCVLDPGVDPDPASQDGPVQVAGLLRLTASALVALGRPFSAVTRNEAIAAELEARLGLYGLDAAFHGVDVLGFGVERVSHHAEWMAAVEPIVRRRREAGVHTVFNGCSAVPRGAVELGGSWLVDPTRFALDLLRAAHGDGLPVGAPVAAVPTTAPVAAATTSGAPR